MSKKGEAGGVASKPASTAASSSKIKRISKKEKAEKAKVAYDLQRAESRKKYLQKRISIRDRLKEKRDKESPEKKEKRKKISEKRRLQTLLLKKNQKPEILRKRKRPEKRSKPLTPEKAKKKKEAIDRKLRVRLSTRTPALYRVDAVPYIKKKRHPHSERVRKSLKPGAVLILLTGKHVGRRVIYLKPLKSGALLVTGPYYLNKTPLRRFRQHYVIATSTKIDISSLKEDIENIDDDYFPKREERVSVIKTDDTFSKKQKPKRKVNLKRLALQRKIDKKILKEVDKVPFLRNYLKARFTLVDGVYPHTIKF